MNLLKLKQALTNDKFLHFVYGIAITALVYPFGDIYAFLATVVFAVGKETLDYKGMGDADAADVIATLLGSSFLLFWYSQSGMFPVLWL